MTKPYIDDDRRLRIPVDAEPKYRWWDDGQSVWETLGELGVPENERRRFIQLYAAESVASSPSFVRMELNGEGGMQVTFGIQLPEELKNVKTLGQMLKEHQRNVPVSNCSELKD